MLMVVKRSGVTEPFSRDKIKSGVRKAIRPRPVDEDGLAKLAQRVQDEIRAKGCAEIASREVGLAILEPLRDLDEVAYLRFASVYRDFTSLADFEEAIEEMRAAARSGAEPGGTESAGTERAGTDGTDTAAAPETGAKAATGT